MKVKYQYSDSIVEGKLIYRIRENSFDFISNHSGDVSILINYLQLTINSSSKKLTSVWGLHPSHLWERTTLSLPPFAKGVVECIDEYESGLSYRLKEFDGWKTYYDSVSGWICVGSLKSVGNSIMFANDLIVTINEGEIISLWLKPVLVN